MQPSLRYFYFFMAHDGRGGQCDRQPTSNIKVDRVYELVKETFSRPVEWQPPPYASFFATEHVRRLRDALTKPLLIVANKLE